MPKIDAEGMFEKWHLSPNAPDVKEDYATFGELVVLLRKQFLSDLNLLIAERVRECVPKDGENQHSVYTHCWNCGCIAANSPSEKTCGECHSTNTSEYFPDCRSAILAKADEVSK